MSKLLELFIRFSEWIRSAYIVKHTEVVSEDMFKSPAWMSLAYKEIGVKEYMPGDNPRIVEYHSSTWLKATEDSVPWCAAFVSWCLEKAGVKSARSPRAQDYLNYGSKIDIPRFGCVVIFKRDSGGHVGFYVDENKENILVLSGNQNDSVNISEYKKTNLLGYRWPKI